MTANELIKKAIEQGASYDYTVIINRDDGISVIAFTHKKQIFCLLSEYVNRSFSDFIKYIKIKNLGNSGIYIEKDCCEYSIADVSVMNNSKFIVIGLKYGDRIIGGGRRYHNCGDGYDVKSSFKYY